MLDPTPPRLADASPPPNRFAQRIAHHGLSLRRARARVLQINVGKRCNLSCSHCHVNAGPTRTEAMTRATLDRVLDWQARHRLPIVDLTGGAPELLPDFRPFIRQLRELDDRATIIDRCNLTVLHEPGQEDLAEFLVSQRVEIVASLPCYTFENVDAQRGDGVFDSSISALQQLNRLGYGRDPLLQLDLVYNPVGASLPGAQAELEADYKHELASRFGIVFNRLLALTNLPIARFASWLKRSGQYDRYAELLAARFNPDAVAGLMCRDTVNVSWDGRVFDCDFNQMTGLPLGGRAPQFLWDIDPALIESQDIATADHCFGCTAGAGSSCGGAIT
jgi:radical SAM/Cys-rich protein